MKKLLSIEIKKIFHTKSFLILLLGLTALAIVIAVSKSTLTLSYVNGVAESVPLSDEGYYTEDAIPFAFNLYNTWMGSVVGEDILVSLFYFLLPLAAVLPYSTSFSEEKNNGYLRHMVLKEGKVKWYITKYAAVFLSGFILIVIPITLNVLVTACFMPAYMPDPLEQLYSGQYYGQYLASVFYSRPLIFVLVFSLLPAIFAGLWAAVSLTISYFVNNKYIVLLIPYILLFYSIDFFEMLFSNRINLELTPFYFLRGGQARYNSNIYVVLGIMLFLFVTTFVITCIRGKKDDVF